MIDRIYNISQADINYYSTLSIIKQHDYRYYTCPHCNKNKLKKNAITLRKKGERISCRIELKANGYSLHHKYRAYNIRLCPSCYDKEIKYQKLIFYFRYVPSVVVIFVGMFFSFISEDGPHFWGIVACAIMALFVGFPISEFWEDIHEDISSNSLTKIKECDALVE